jgi:hypothetical protein
MLNLLVPLVGIMNIMKINQYQNPIKNIYGCRMWFNGLKYTKTCYSFHLKQNVKIKNI